MTRRTALALALTLCWTASALAAPPGPLVRYVGTIDARTAPGALDLIAGDLDKVVGLRLRVEPSTEAQFKTTGYLVNREPGSLSINARKKGDYGYELFLRSGYRAERGGYVVDGFFRVKNGGMHQGVLSYGLEPVSAAAVGGRPVRDRPIR